MRASGRSARAAGLIAALAAAGVHGCATWPGFGPARLRDCPGTLVDVEEIPGGDFLLRERLRVRGEDVDFSVDLVAERRGPHLVVVGLDAFGARVFHVEQEGVGVSSASRFGPMLPLPPENALRDLHAARFATPDRGGRVEISRPGCGYSATFLRIERRGLGNGERDS